MASVYQPKKSRFWYACYADQHGKQIRKSTKQPDKSAALKIALELERAERMARDGVATSVQFQKLISHVSREATGESLHSPSVRDYFAEWMDSIKHKNAAGTRERYANTIRLFLESLGDFAKQPARGLTPRHIEAFMRRRLDSRVAPKTVIVDIKTLSSGLRRAEVFGYIDKNPVPAVKLPKNVSMEREIFSADEIQKLVQAAPNLDWQTLILIAFYSGARLGDCVGMRWDNVDTEKGFLVYCQKKTGKKIAAPLHIHLIRHLAHVSETNAEGFLCPSIARKTPGGKHGLSESFKRIVKRAGLDLMTVPGMGKRNFSRRTFHSIRHTFNSNLANNDVHADVRMSLTGHTTRETNEKYTHRNMELLKRAIDTLPSLQPQK